METSRNKQFIHFILLTSLSSMMKSFTTPCHPVSCFSDVNRPFVQHSLPIGHLVAVQVIRPDCPGVAVLVFKSSLFYLIKFPKCKNSDAGNSDLPKRSRRVLSISEKVKVLNLIRKENKNHMLKLLRSMVRMNHLSVKL